MGPNTKSNPGHDFKEMVEGLFYPSDEKEPEEDESEEKEEEDE